MNVGSSLAHSHELVGASAVTLRIAGGHCPSEAQIAGLGEIVTESLAVGTAGAACGVTGQGWLACTDKGLREAFRLGCELERRIIAALPRMEAVLAHSATILWGIWSDQYLLPFDQHGHPVLGDVTARAIFSFEADNVLLCSEAVYQANRRWEQFVCVPRRLLSGEEDFGYRLIGHKRPSAFDHAEIGYMSPFVGRRHELSLIDDCWKSAGPNRTLAILAEAGSGKTRLIREWLARHPEVRASAASFSLFGGAVEDFARQLAEFPQERLDHDALVRAVVDRVRRERVDALVLDDLHWAGSEGMAFVDRLLGGLSTEATFVVLASRPGGREQVRALRPAAELALEPLSTASSQELARRLIKAEVVANVAAARSQGNALFIEQFAAWAAETQYHGGEDGPRTLYEVIAARIDYLSNVRLEDVQKRLRWGGSWEREAVQDELARLEIEAGLWLDRLETGDYADRIEAARHLAHLERLEFNIFLTGALAGRAQSRSSRLREAIERLLLGSADQILADLRRRAVEPSVVPDNIAREAEHAADVLFAAFKWRLAREFYELARSAGRQHSEHVTSRLDQCRRQYRTHVRDDEVFGEGYDLERRPSVAALDLPYVWAQLGRRLSCAEYLSRAADAAEAINDPGLAAWARRKAMALRAAD